MSPRLHACEFLNGQWAQHRWTKEFLLICCDEEWNFQFFDEYIYCTAATMQCWDLPGTQLVSHAWVLMFGPSSIMPTTARRDCGTDSTWQSSAKDSINTASFCSMISGNWANIRFFNSVLCVEHFVQPQVVQDDLNRVWRDQQAWTQEHLQFLRRQYILVCQQLCQSNTLVDF